MPPKKRAASSAGTGASASKRAKTPSDEPPRSKRWSAVSGSANADAGYKIIWKDPDTWYSFVTICPPIQDDEDEDDEEEDEDSEEEEREEQDEARDQTEKGGRAGPKCGRKGCQCFMPAEEHPDHPWVVSQAGYRKYTTQLIHLELRDPDNFGMYTFNDHAGYGCLEVVQNLFLDYVEAAERGWKEQWAVCEGLGILLLSSASSVMMMIDDGECVDETLQLAGRMFLNMLAQLDNLDLVGDATEVKGVGTTMAIYMKVASDVREVGVLEVDDDKVKKKKFQPKRFDDAILSYANQRGVTLQGPPDIDELTAELDGDVELPKKNSKDPWGWTAALKKYKDDYASLTGSMTGKKKSSDIGGDSLDITTWSSAERKAKSFTKKDPLRKQEIDAIKKGMVMQLG